MTTKEVNEEVMAWAEVLHGLVPEDNLYDCYLGAIRAKDRVSRFPLAATEVLEHWRRWSALQTKTFECDFCKQHKYDPSEFPPCRFHSKVAQP
jgi:hypothetical protein